MKSLCAHSSCTEAPGAKAAPEPGLQLQAFPTDFPQPTRSVSAVSDPVPKLLPALSEINPNPASLQSKVGKPAWGKCELGVCTRWLSKCLPGRTTASRVQKCNEMMCSSSAATQERRRGKPQRATSRQAHRRVFGHSVPSEHTDLVLGGRQQ